MYFLCMTFCWISSYYCIVHLSTIIFKLRSSFLKRATYSLWILTWVSGPASLFWRFGLFSAFSSTIPTSEKLMIQVVIAGGFISSLNTRLSNPCCFWPSAMTSWWFLFPSPCCLQGRQNLYRHGWLEATFGYLGTHSWANPNNRAHTYVGHCPLICPVIHLLEICQSITESGD